MACHYEFRQWAVKLSRRSSHQDSNCGFYSLTSNVASCCSSFGDRQAISCCNWTIGFFYSCATAQCNGNTFT